MWHAVTPSTKWVGTFWMCPLFTRWVWAGRIVSEPTINSQCTHWVYCPSPPVNGRCRRWGRGVVLAVVARGFVIEGGGRGTRRLLESEISGNVFLEPLCFSFLGFGHDAFGVWELIYCYVRIWPDLDVPKEGRKTESGGQLSTVLTRTCAGETRSRPEETKTAGAKPEFPSVPKEPQRETRRDK